MYFSHLAHTDFSNSVLNSNSPHAPRGIPLAKSTVWTILSPVGQLALVACKSQKNWGSPKSSHREKQVCKVNEDSGHLALLTAGLLLSARKGSSTRLLLPNRRNILQITFYIYIFNGEPPNPVTSDFMTWLLSDAYTRQLCPLEIIKNKNDPEFLLVLRIYLVTELFCMWLFPNKNWEKKRESSEPHSV